MLSFYSVQTHASLFFYNQGDKVTFLCSYGFWFCITKGTETQHLCLQFLIQYSQGEGATALNCV